MMAPEPFRKTHQQQKKKAPGSKTPQRERRESERENKENKKTLLLR
jgi:hypothetical protein